MNQLSRLPEDINKSIVALVQSFVERWNGKDAEIFGEIFTENAEFTDIVNQIAIGRQAIVEQHRFPFAVVNRIAVMSIDQLYTRALDDHLIMVTGSWLCQKSTTPKGELLPDRRGIIQLVCRWEDGSWKICLVHNTDFTQVYNPHVDTSLRFFQS